MAETGSSILGYTGNAQLGLAENSAIPVVANKPDLDAVNQASQNLRLYDHQNNIMLYQQKIADRDATLKLLAQGKVNSGKILPEDQKYYDELEKAQTASYKAIKGMQDKDGIADYLTKTQQLNDLVTNAQHRWTEVTKLETEKAGKTLPKDIEAYDNHIKKQRAKAIGELVDPYQPAYSGNFDDMATQIKGSQMITKGIGGTLPTDALTKPGTKAKPGTSAVGGAGTLTPFQDTQEKYYDYPTMLKRSEQLYIADREQTENQRQWFNKFHEAPPFMQEDLINKYNDRIKTYSEQRSIAPNENGIYPDQIKYRKMPDGKFLLEETPSSFAAKHTLATVEGDYVQKPQKVFDKDIADYLLGKEKAGTDRLYKMSMAAAAGKKAGAYVANIRSQIKAREGEPEQNKYLDEIYNRNLVEQPTLISPSGKKDAVVLSDIQNEKSLPIFTFDKTGKPSLLKPYGSQPILDDKKKVIGYKGGNYKQQYIFGGKNIDPHQIMNMYLKFKKDNAGKWDKGLDDYLKMAIDNNLFDVKLSGENGSTDRIISREAQRAISNSLTKKGQDAVFEIEEPQEEVIIQE